MDEKNLIFFKTKSLGSAYNIANLLAKSGFSLLETFPIGGGGHLLMEYKNSPVAPIPQFDEEITSEIVGSQVVLNCPNSIYKAYLSLENFPVQDHLLVLDFEFLGEAFKLAEGLVKRGFGLVDIRLMRGISSHCYLIFTSESIARLRDAHKELKALGHRCQLLEDLHPDLKQIL